ACTKPEHLMHWWVGGWDHVVHFAETDVRVGGKHRVGFGPAGTQPYIEVGEYTEVVPLKRLAYRETVKQGDDVMHVNDTVIELRDLGGNRTEISVTTSGGEAWRNAEGWVPGLEKLAALVERKEIAA